MRICRPLLFFLLFLYAGAQAFAQHGRMHTEKTVYYFAFNGAHSLQDVQLVRDSIMPLPGVIEFKPRYKPESGLSEIMVVVVEKLNGPEARPQFNEVRVKNILWSFGYSLTNLTTQHIKEHEDEKEH